MTSEGRFYKKNFWLLLIVLSTLILISSHTYLKIAKGPHGVFFFDPEFRYLKNSLMLLEGKGVEHTDHPGTTVQIIGAATIWVLHKIIDGDTQLAQSGSEKAEFYLTAINYTIFIIFIFTYIITAYNLWKFFILILYCCFF